MMFPTCEVQVGNAIEYGTKSRATRIGGDFADVDDDDDVNYDEYEL